MRYIYNPKKYGFDEILPPMPPPPGTPPSAQNDQTGYSWDRLLVNEVNRLQPSATELAAQIAEYHRKASEQYLNQGPGDVVNSSSVNTRPGSGGGGSSGFSNSGGGGFSGAPPSGGGQSPQQQAPNADSIVSPNASFLSKIPAPPGYAWAINPLNGEAEAIDLTPLDKTQPIGGWKWIPEDASNPEKGDWRFIPTADVLDKPFEGVPTPIIGWLQTALDAGGDLNVVPDGAARQWVKYILTQATNPGRTPGTVPFGTGVPDFQRADYSPPTQMPQAPTSEGENESATRLRTVLEAAGWSSAEIDAIVSKL